MHKLSEKKYLFVIEQLHRKNDFMHDFMYFVPILNLSSRKNYNIDIIISIFN